MAREPYERLPAWRGAMKLAMLTHRLAAALPAEEKSGLAGAMKKPAMGVPVKVATADAAETSGTAIKALQSCEPALRELMTTALLAYQLSMLRRPHLRKLRATVDRVRKLLDAEIDAWDASREDDAPRNDAADDAPQNADAPAPLTYPRRAA